jgi:transposase
MHLGLTQHAASSRLTKGPCHDGNESTEHGSPDSCSLEEFVPPDHFYRRLDQTLDLSFVRDLVQHTYTGTGRPSLDPVVFFTLQLVMFFEGIRPERHLLLLVADRLSVRWYVGYNLYEPLPDHSSLTRICSRYGLEVFRRFFEAIVEQCQQAGLVWGRELYFDAIHMLANAALDSLAPRFPVEARAALHAHLATLFLDETADEEQAAVDVARTPREQVAAPAQDLDSHGLPELRSPTQLPPPGAANGSRDRGAARAQCGGDVLLPPPLLVQLPGALAPPLARVGRSL